MTKNILDKKLFTNEYPNYGIQNKGCMFQHKEFIITLVSVETNPCFPCLWDTAKFIRSGLPSWIH